MSKVKFQASPGLSRYGKSGPPVQHSGTITMSELKELIEREKIKPEQLFTKEQIVNDPKLKPKIDALIDAEIAAIKAKAKTEEDRFIPDDTPPNLTPKEREQQRKDNELVADGKGDSEDNDLIPDEDDKI